jgi:CubicO group peptidase (beta-lactamase class C family)
MKGFKMAGLAALDTQHLETRVQHWIYEKQIPGLALALVSEHETVYTHGFGVTSVEDGATAVTSQTVFPIASVTKMLVGTALSRLVESGQLALDAPVTTYLPDFHFSRAGEEERITIRQLLSHTSGLCTFRGDFSSHEPDGLARFVREALPSYPLLLPPGVAWLYSNAGFALLAYIAETLTQKAFRDLMAELVFDPLEMRRTTFDPLVAMTYPMAQSHLIDSDGHLHVEHRFIQNTAIDASSGLWSTADDLAHVAQAYLNHGVFHGQRILLPETIREMQTPLVWLWTLRNEGYGLAVATEEYKGVSLVRHNGGGRSSYGACFYLAPSENIGVIALANRPGFIGLLHEIFDMLFNPPGSSPRQPVAAPDRAAWPRFVGAYLGHLTGLVTIGLVSDQLILKRNGKEFTLRQIGENEFVGEAADGEQIAIGFPGSESGEAPYVVLDDGPCQRIAAPSAIPPNPALWQTFVGTYRLPEAALVNDNTFVVSRTNDIVSLTWRETTVLCIPLESTRLACDFGLIRFTAATKGPLLEIWQTMTARRVAD